MKTITGIVLIMTFLLMSFGIYTDAIASAIGSGVISILLFIAYVYMELQDWLKDQFKNLNNR